MLSGGNWLPGETVHIHVAATGGHSWSFDGTIVTFADGSSMEAFVRLKR